MSQSCGIQISSADKPLFYCEVAASFRGYPQAKMKLPPSAKAFSYAKRLQQEAVKLFWHDQLMRPMYISLNYGLVLNSSSKIKSW